MGQAAPTSTEIDRITHIAERLACRGKGSLSDAIDRLERLATALHPDIAMAKLHVRALQRVRGHRNERLGVDLFRDPAWDMLLELAAANLSDQPVSVSSLCFASGVPATTALRYIDRMVEEGLVVRIGDDGDHRRVLIRIAPAMLAPVEALLRDFHAALISAEMRGDGPAKPPPPILRSTA